MPFQKEFEVRLLHAGGHGVTFALLPVVAAGGGEALLFVADGLWRFRGNGLLELFEPAVLSRYRRKDFMTAFFEQDGKDEDILPASWEEFEECFEAKFCCVSKKHVDEDGVGRRKNICGFHDFRAFWVWLSLCPFSGGARVRCTGKR